MRAGAFDRRIQIVEVQASPVTDDHAQPVVSETTIATLWAQFIQQSAKEFLREGVTTTETRAVFRIRYLAGITTDHRILDWLNRKWNITEVREISRREGLDLYCMARG